VLILAKNGTSDILKAMKMAFLLATIAPCAAWSETIELTDGCKIVGTVIDDNASTLVVETESLGVVRIPKSHVSYDKPGLTQTRNVPWSGALSATFSTAQRAKNTDDYGFKMTAQRDDKQYNLVLKADWRYARDQKDGVQNTTQDSQSLSASLERKLPEKKFVRALIDLERDRINGIDLRTVNSISYGAELLGRGPGTLKGNIGIASVNYQFSDQPDATFGTLTAGIRYQIPLLRSTKLTAFFDYYPTLDDSSRFHLSGGLSFETSLQSSWFLNLTMDHRYDSIASNSKNKRTLRYWLGIGYKF